MAVAMAIDLFMEILPLGSIHGVREMTMVEFGQITDTSFTVFIDIGERLHMGISIAASADILGGTYNAARVNLEGLMDNSLHIYI